MFTALRESSGASSVYISLGLSVPRVGPAKMAGPTKELVTARYLNYERAKL